jgi:CheY-like chemotaxis protein
MESHKMSEPKRILYVEDESDIQAVAQIALETVGGFTIKICSSGDEALAEAEAFAPDLLLLDVMMPDMDGPSTLCELRKLPGLSDTPAIFMTAKVQPQEIEHFKSLGAIDVVPKPFDPMALADQIKTIWKQHISLGS